MKLSVNWGNLAPAVSSTLSGPMRFLRIPYTNTSNATGSSHDFQNRSPSYGPIVFTALRDLDVLFLAERKRIWDR